MSPFRRTAYLLAFFSVLAGLVTVAWKPAPPPVFAGIQTGDVPSQLGPFRSLGDYEVDPTVRAALSAADIVARTYNDGSSAATSDSQPIDFILIGGTDRSALHDPRSCLVGGGWHLEDDRTEPLPGANGTVEARACHAVGGPGASSFDIVYLYVVDGKIVNQVTQIRAEMLASALLGRKNRPVYFLRVMQPLDPDPAKAASNHQRLLAFAANAWNALRPRLGASANPS